jgi:hypothetical protein
VPRLRMVKLHVHSSIHVHGMVLNQLSPGIISHPYQTSIICQISISEDSHFQYSECRQKKRTVYPWHKWEAKPEIYGNNTLLRNREGLWHSMWRFNVRDRLVCPNNKKVLLELSVCLPLSGNSRLLWNTGTYLYLPNYAVTPQITNLNIYRWITNCTINNSSFVLVSLSM